MRPIQEGLPQPLGGVWNGRGVNFAVFSSNATRVELALELRQQFVLINNTRPLPKTLIYELLPSTPGLPEKFTARAFASKVVEILNYDENYRALHGKIK